jgi:transcriptional regulator with XRE-family HTH domain
MNMPVMHMEGGKMHFGEKIKQYREQVGWTQAELARRAGIGQPYVSKIESQVIGMPSITAVEALAKAFKKDVTYLIEGTDYRLTQPWEVIRSTDIGYCPNLRCPGSNFSQIARPPQNEDEEWEVNRSHWQPYKTPLFDEDEEPIVFCIHCGYKLETECKNCGRKVKQTYRFCPGCGQECFIEDPEQF